MDHDEYSLEKSISRSPSKTLVLLIVCGISACGTSSNLSTEPSNTIQTTDGNNIPLAAIETDNSTNPIETNEFGVPATSQPPDSAAAHGEEDLNAEADNHNSASASLTCNTLSVSLSTRAISLINEFRAETRACGNQVFDAASAVAWNDKLYDAANNHSMDMASVNFFSHTGSDGSDIGSRVTQADYDWWTIGENIAAGQSTVEQAINGWIQSPGHCRNLMNPDFTEVAVACVADENSDYEFYWTNVLAAPR